MNLVYVASPYAHPDPRVSAILAEWAAREVAYLTAGDYPAESVYYSPIAHGHALYRANRSLSLSWEFWRPICFAMLAKADELMILQLPGWEASVGIRAEIEEWYRLYPPAGSFRRAPSYYPPIDDLSHLLIPYTKPRGKLP